MLPALAHRDATMGTKEMMVTATGMNRIIIATGITATGIEDPEAGGIEGGDKPIRDHGVDLKV